MLYIYILRFAFNLWRQLFFQIVLNIQDFVRKSGMRIRLYEFERCLENTSSASFR